MRFERGTVQSFIVPARLTLSPSKWLLRFVNISDPTQIQSCIAIATPVAGEPVLVTFEEVDTGAVNTAGEITLVPGQWELSVHEQTSTTNLNYQNADRRDVFTQLVEVVGAEIDPPAPQDPCDSCENNCATVDVTFDGYTVAEDQCGGTVALDCDTLADVVIVSGAGEVNTNGTYTPQVPAPGLGQAVGSTVYGLGDGVHYIYVLPNGIWVLVDSDAGVNHYSTEPNTPEYPWGSAWALIDGAAPIPTVAQGTIADYCGGGGSGPCDDATVTVNSAAFDTVTAGATLDVVIQDTAAAPVGTVIAGPAVEIGDADITINGGPAVFATVVAEGVKDIDVWNVAGTPVGAASGSVWEVGVSDINTTDGLTQVDVVNAEDSYNLPQSVIKYTDAANSPQVTAAANTEFAAATLRPATLVPRRQILNTAGNAANATYADLDDLISNTLPTAGDATAVVKNLNGTTLVTEAIPSNASENITAPIPLKFGWGAGDADTLVWTVTDDEAGTYATYTQDGGSGTITYSKNGGAFAALTGSISLAISDTIRVRRTITTNAGFSKWAP